MADSQSHLVRDIQRIPGCGASVRQGRRAATLSAEAAIRTLLGVGQPSFRVEPLDATFGAVVRDIELRALDDGTWAALYDTWLQYALLIFPDQFLTRPEQDDFARRFGDLEFAASPIANVDADGTVHSAPEDD